MVRPRHPAETSPLPIADSSMNEVSSGGGRKQQVSVTITIYGVSMFDEMTLLGSDLSSKVHSRGTDLFLGHINRKTPVVPGKYHFTVI